MQDFWRSVYVKFFSRTNGIETCHVALGTQASTVCIIDNPGLPLTYFTTRSNLVTYACCMGETVKVIELEKLAANDQIDTGLMFLKNLITQGASDHARGLYTCI